MIRLRLKMEKNYGIRTNGRSRRSRMTATRANALSGNWNRPRKRKGRNPFHDRCYRLWHGQYPFDHQGARIYRRRGRGVRTSGAIEELRAHRFAGLRFLWGRDETTAGDWIWTGDRRTDRARQADARYLSG